MCVLECLDVFPRESLQSKSPRSTSQLQKLGELKTKLGWCNDEDDDDADQKVEDEEELNSEYTTITIPLHSFLYKKNFFLQSVWW